MVSMLSNIEIENTLVQFFTQLTQTLGFVGYLAIALGVEVLFILLYGIKSAFSYEARFKRAMNKANHWLFAHKKLTTDNIRQFTNVLKRAPKRVTHFWQQFIMYREGGPVAYMTEENLIEKPLRTSSWVSNVKNLGIVTIVWSFVSLILGIASQATKTLTIDFETFMLALLLPLGVALIGGIAIMMIKGFRVYNLDDVYEGYHIFSRFLTNACDELPPYIELEMLFNKRELSRASIQLKEFYESNARKAKLAFDEAKRREEKISEFDFSEVGVDGALLLDRAMRESENYINQRTKIQSQIAQVEAQKDAMRRNYENIQMDLQRKIQAAKENIQKLIEQQAATTSRIEVGLLRQQQDKEAKKLEELQRDYDKEETRYKSDRDEQEKEIEALREVMRESLSVAEKGMTNEYNSFLEKLMKSVYIVAAKKVEREQKELERQSDKNENELISVQTQIKRLMDENMTLRDKLQHYNSKYKSEEPTPQGHYDENGNFIYEDGSYHDTQGLFHDVDGNVYNMNGELVSKDYTEEEAEIKEQQDLQNSQINQFGAYIDDNGNKIGATLEDQKVEDKPAETKTPIIEDFDWDEPKAEEPIQSQVSEEKKPLVEDFIWDEPASAQPEQQVQQKVEQKGAELPVEDEFVYDQPAKEDVIAQEEKPASTSRGRGRPRKEVTEEVVNKPTRGRGRPRKTEISAQDIDSVARISQLISEEEEKLSKMRNMLNNEIQAAVVDETEIDREKEKLVKEFESLKLQAEAAKAAGTPEEVAQINTRLQALIKEINILNNKK